MSFQEACVMQNLARECCGILQVHESSSWILGCFKIIFV